MTAALSLEDSMAAIGVKPSRSLSPTPGQVLRFHIQGDRPGTCNGWLITDELGNYAVFGSWKTGIKCVWRPIGPAVPSYIRAQLTQQAKDAEAHRLAETKAKALLEAKEIWGAAEPPFQHAYLARKQISGVGARQFGSRLIVPVFNASTRLQSLQHIDESGNKRFHRGLSLKGGFLLLGHSPKSGAPVLLCEGYATGATLFESLGMPVAIAFSAGNLLEVGRIMRTLYNSKLWVCADNDHATVGNPGLTKARAAAYQLHGRLIVPPTIPGITDFNDLFCLSGKAALLACIEAVPPAH
ncbi:toprim domain-containing protein [Aeromonas jandaei]|uniref:toprim domain-containing protein n=1 Tax=Aeromonas jandaei TaxID=650 RepID=UPI003D252B05